MPPLFVYGTLRPGSGHPNARRLAAESIALGRATACGLLWRVARYPGLTRGGHMIAGDLVRLRSDASLAWLDRYEMCGPDDPDPHPYARRLVGVRWRGHTVAALTYLWVAPVTGKQVVRGGDWLHQ